MYFGGFAASVDFSYISCLWHFAGFVVCFVFCLFGFGVCLLVILNLRFGGLRSLFRILVFVVWRNCWRFWFCVVLLEHTFRNE